MDRAAIVKYCKNALCSLAGGVPVRIDQACALFCVLWFRIIRDIAQYFHTYTYSIYWDMGFGVPFSEALEFGTFSDEERELSTNIFNQEC